MLGKWTFLREGWLGGGRIGPRALASAMILKLFNKIGRTQKSRNVTVE